MRLAINILGVIGIIIWTFSYIYGSQNLIKDNKKLKSIILFISKSGIFFLDRFGTNKKIISFDLRMEIRELYGIENEENIIFILEASRFSSYLLFSALSLIIYSISLKFDLFILFLALGLLYQPLLTTSIKVKFKSRRKEMVKDLPDVLTNIYLLMESGLPAISTIDYIANSGEKDINFLFKEARNSIKNGKDYKLSLEDINKFANISYIKKLSNLLIKSIETGVDNMEDIKQLRDEILKDKNTELKMKANAISGKLLIPNMIIFIAILIQIMVPAFAIF